MSNSKPKQPTVNPNGSPAPKRENRNWKPARFSANSHTKRIWQWFVRPLAMEAQMEQEERTFDMNARIEIALGDQFRTVSFAKATEGFKLPPTVWQSPSRPNWLAEELDNALRTVKPGDALTLRSDVRTPDLFEVEFGDRVFVVSEREFREIESKVKVVV